jgi:beta-glucosidase/6-phospho-beta-glucosidase/beta-galactosidase
VGLLKKFRSSMDLMSDTKRKEVPYLKFLMICMLIADGQGRVNQEGVDYYNNLINELLSKGSHVH